MHERVAEISTHDAPISINLLLDEILRRQGLPRLEMEEFLFNIVLGGSLFRHEIDVSAAGIDIKA